MTEPYYERVHGVVTQQQYYLYMYMSLYTIMYNYIFSHRRVYYEYEQLLLAS